MGADSEGKQKLDRELVATDELFADVVQQAITVGEYEKALKTGPIDKERIPLIGTGINGQAGRAPDRQITIFDSSKMALQDIALSRRALEKAFEKSLAKEI